MKFGVIGTGVVGTTLAVKLTAAGHQCIGVNTRSDRSYANFSKYLRQARLPLEQLVPQAEVLFITTQDDMIARVAEQCIVKGLYREGQVWVHCSGALEADVLKAGCRDLPFKCLSLHPLQAFADVPTALELMTGTHFGIEGDVPEFGEQLVRDLGGVPHRVEGKHKALYHAGAVTASNYLVTLASLAVELLTQAGMNREEALTSFLPLMQGTLANLERTGLPDALTGPIARGDVQVVKRHLEVMPEHLRRIYGILGERTLALAEEKWKRQNREYPPDARQAMVQLLAIDPRDSKEKG